MNNDESFFEKYGLKLEYSEVEVGKTYPIFGMITDILSEEIPNIKVVINFNIIATLYIDTKEKMNVLKERAYDSGVFICTITDKNSKIYADCSCVVFGKRESLTQ